jgi:hypothetical protein
MVVRFGDAVMAFHIADGQGFSEVFTNRFSNWVTNKGAILDVTEFDWVEGHLSQRSMYQFEGELFYCGLAILPIYGYSAVERVVVPLSEEVVAFAKSHINSIGINSLLSQLHWQEGDHFRCVDGIYQLADVQLYSGCALAFRFPAEPNRIAQLFPLNELRRACFIGDW